MSKEEKAEQLTQAIINTCKNLGVEPDETLDVLGMATGNILTTIAPMFGVSPRQMLQIFGKGIANAELTERKGS